MMPYLTLIRHGQSTYNLANLFTGNVDAPLTSLGEAEALAAGVFGAPSYVLPSGEFFWGQDRLEFVERALARK